VKPVTIYDWENDRKVLTVSGSYPWSFVTHIFCNDEQSYDGERRMHSIKTCTIKLSYTQKK
jgi:hypothetical protein